MRQCVQLNLVNSETTSESASLSRYRLSESVDVDRKSDGASTFAFSKMLKTLNAERYKAKINKKGGATKGDLTDNDDSKGKIEMRVPARKWSLQQNTAIEIQDFRKLR